MKIIVLLLLAVVLASADQTAPGTASRPILTASESNYFTTATYLQGWSPPSISTSKADYTVGNGYNTIQAAVNAAINAGGTTRKYIKINAGTYQEVVYIPNTKVPLTIYGGGSSPSDTLITLNMPAQTTPSAYKSLVGSLFNSADPAYSMYNSWRSKSGAIGTSCSTVFWGKAPAVQIVNLSIENSAKNTGDQQAVALQTNSDQIQIHNARLLGYQDTLYAGSGSSSVERSYYTNTYIEGDIDFVFGGGSAIFESCTFYVKADRRSDTSVVFAPDTDPHKMYGYFVYKSTITGDSAWSSSKKAYLGRAWDSAVSSSSAYVPGTSPNGQLIIKESTIDGIINTSGPWTTATSGRTYSGNNANSRDLNNDNYNRFWEYNNSGNGA
nr:pectin methylesterase [Sitophilus oryzae]